MSFQSVQPSLPAYFTDVKLPWIFLSTPLIFNGAPANIQGNFDGNAFNHGIYNIFTSGESINTNKQ